MRGRNFAGVAKPIGKFEKGIKSFFGPSQTRSCTRCSRKSIKICYQMDQTVHTNRFSPPRYAGALQLDAYSSSAPTARPSPSNAGVYTPSSVLFPSQRSPKGPRPAPSSVYAHNFVEPARVPLPKDDVDALQHAPANNMYHYGDPEEGFSIPTAEPTRQVIRCIFLKPSPQFFSFSRKWRTDHPLFRQKRSRITNSFIILWNLGVSTAFRTRHANGVNLVCGFIFPSSQPSQHAQCPLFCSHCFCSRPLGRKSSDRSGSRCYRGPRYRPCPIHPGRHSDKFHPGSRALYSHWLLRFACRDGR